MGPVVFGGSKMGPAALTWVELPFFRPHLAIPATRGRRGPALTCAGGAPGTAPGEGSGAAGTSGSPAPSGEKPRARRQGPSRASGGPGRAKQARSRWGRGRGGRAGLWGPGNPGAGRKEGGKAAAGLPTPKQGREAGGPDARVEVLRASSSVRGSEEAGCARVQGRLDPRGHVGETPGPSGGS